MCVEKRFGGTRTPEELLALLPRAKPFDNGVFLTPFRGQEGIYKFEVPLFKTIEKFDWLQLYNLADVPGKSDAAVASSLAPSHVTPPELKARTAKDLVLEEC